MSKPIDGKIRIMVVDDVETSRSTLSRLLSFEPDMDVVAMAATGAEAITKAKEIKPDVILMDINMPDMDGLTATENINRTVPTSVVMISVQNDRDYIRRALQVGATDFLPKPPTADELYDAIRRAYERRPAPMTFPQPDLTGPQVGVRGKIIVVFSPQGGAGVTTCAINIASGLTTNDETSVLIDCNLQYGDVAIHLDLPNERNLLDLTQVASDLDNEIIENILATHPSGLRVLAGPARPEHAEEINLENALTVIEAVSERFDYVVIDTPPQLNDFTVTLFELADLIVLVGVPTLPAAKNLRITLDLLNKIEGLSADKFFFVMNQVQSDKKSGALAPEAVGTTLNLPIKGAIPFTLKPFLESITRGVPTIVNLRQSPGKELKEIVDGIRATLFPMDEDEQEALATAEKSRRRRR